MTGETVFDALDVALHGSPPLFRFDFSLAGDEIRVCADTPELLRQVTASLRHRQVESAAAPNLTIFAFEQQPRPTQSARPEWQLAQRWQQQEPVRANGPEGMMYFDPFSDEVTVLDLTRRRAARWFGSSQSIPNWVLANPFLRILDAWFADRGRVLCHAAAIARQGEAALIFGPGGAGKSTLALHALDQSFQYLGDDYVLLESTSSGAVVHSIHCSGKLFDADLAGTAPRSASVYRPAEDSAGKAVLFPDPGLLCAQAPLRLAIEPRFGHGEKPRLERISMAEALRGLLPSTLRQFPGGEKRKLALLGGAFAGLPCYRLHLTRDHRLNLDAIGEAMAALSRRGGA